MFYSRGSHGKVITVKNVWEVNGTESQEKLKSEYNEVNKDNETTDVLDLELDLAVKATLDKMKEVYPENEVALIYLNGSRLYGYNREDSDYDFTVYTSPTKRELLFDKWKSSEIEVNENKVDSVKVRDIRFITHVLKKPNLTALTLLDYPVYINKGYETLVDNLKPMVTHSLDVNRKQLALSLLGAIKSNKKEARKTLTLLLYDISVALMNDDFNLTLDFIKDFSRIKGRDAELWEEFESDEAIIFKWWVDKKVKPEQLDYESLFL